VSKERLTSTISLGLVLASLGIAGGGCGGSSKSAEETTSDERTRESQSAYECLERSAVAEYVTDARYEPDPLDSSVTRLVIRTTIAPGDYDTGVPIVTAAFDCQDRPTAVAIIDRNGDELP
jgi:hypothetical protein